MSHIFILLKILQHNNFQPIITSSNGQSFMCIAPCWPMQVIVHNTYQGGQRTGTWKGKIMIIGLKQGNCYVLKLQSLNQHQVLQINLVNLNWDELTVNHFFTITSLVSVRKSNHLHAQGTWSWRKSTAVPHPLLFFQLDMEILMWVK